MTRLERLVMLLVPAAVLAFILAASNQIAQSVYNIPNWGRLQKTFVVAAGLPLYYGKFSGPALTAGYGPVSVLLYLPATLFQDPSAVIMAASTVAALCFFVPAALFFRPRPLEALFFAGFGFFTMVLYSLKNAAFNVHSDAPALGFAALAAALLSPKEEGRRPWIALSALAAVLAVWAKFVALPVLAALPLYAALAYGRREGARYLVWLAAWGAAVTALVLFFFGAHDLYFNLVTLFSKHPLKEGAGVLAFLDKWLREQAMIVPMLVPAFILWRKDGRLLAHRRWMLPALLGLFLLPASYLGFAKIGGSRNNISYTDYFFILAALLAWVELAGEADWKGRVYAAALVLLGSLTLGQAAYAVSDRWFQPPRRDYAREAYDFARSHPGESYFPTLTLVHWLAERKFYHEAPALADREIAGYGPDAGHLAAYMPHGMKIIAFPEGNDFMGWLHAPGFGRRGEDARLPGFWVYKKS